MQLPFRFSYRRKNVPLASQTFSRGPRILGEVEQTAPVPLSVLLLFCRSPHAYRKNVSFHNRRHSRGRCLLRSSANSYLHCCPRTLPNIKMILDAGRLRISLLLQALPKSFFSRRDFQQMNGKTPCTSYSKCLVRVIPSESTCNRIWGCPGIYGVQRPWTCASMSCVAVS